MNLPQKTSRLDTSHHHHHRLKPLDPTITPSAHHLHDNMNVVRSDYTELPPLVGVIPHPQDRLSHHPMSQTDPPTIVNHRVAALGGLDEDVATPNYLLTRRRLKLMLRQCSDSELIQNHAAPKSQSSSPVPHPPPDTTGLRSQTSPELNCRQSPQIYRKPFVPNSPRSNRGASRSLDASPMVVRRGTRGPLRRGSAEPDTLGSTPTGSDHEPKPRPFSFGSFSDVLQHVGINQIDASLQVAQGPGSPFSSRRAVGIRGGVAHQRPDTPVTDVLLMKDKHQPVPTSSSDLARLEGSDRASLLPGDYVDKEETIQLWRRLRHDSGCTQRNSDLNKKHPSGGGGATLPNDHPSNKHSSHSASHDDDISENILNEDPSFPSNLYDIEERRESVLSIDACQQIARMVAKDNQSEDDADEEYGDINTNKKPRNSNIPEYRKAPLSSSLRVSNWLNGIQDPTAVAPSTYEVILPEIT